MATFYVTLCAVFCSSFICTTLAASTVFVPETTETITEAPTTTTTPASTTHVPTVPPTPAPTTPVPTDQAAFASNIYNHGGAQNPVRFDGLAINRGGHLNQDTWELTIPYSGLYLVSMSAGHPGNGLTNYKLQLGNNPLTAIYRAESVPLDEITMGRDFIAWFNYNEQLSIRSDGPMLRSSLDTLATSWGSLALSGLMQTTVGFSVGKSTNFSSGQVTFDTIFADTQGAWNANTNTFTVPDTGIYFFTFSTGVRAGNRVNLHLRVNGVDLYRIHRHPDVTVSEDSFQRSIMLSMFAQDTVQLYSEHDGFSHSEFSTTFGGFQYSTQRPVRLAWSVFRGTSVTANQDPLVFDHIAVNEGGAWQENQAVCAFSGLYYVHISGVTTEFEQFRLQVIKGSEFVGGVRFDLPGSFETVSKSMIVECAAGETIRVRSVGQAYSGDNERDINFLGFYMFA